MSVRNTAYRTYAHRVQPNAQGLDSPRLTNEETRLIALAFISGSFCNDDQETVISDEEREHENRFRIPPRLWRVLEGSILAP